MSSNVALSSRTVARPLGDLAGEIQSILKNKTCEFGCYTTWMDEISDVSDAAQLVVFYAALTEIS